MGHSLRFQSPAVNAKKGLGWAFFALGMALAVAAASFYFFLWRPQAAKGVPSRAQGEHFFKTGQYKRALSNFHSLANVPGKENEGRLGIAKSLMVLAWSRYDKNGWESYAKNRDDYMPSEELNRAEEILRDLLEAEPQNAEAPYLIGLIYQEKGWFYRAIREYERALELRPDHWDACNNIGVCYVELLEYGQAELSFKNMIAKYPGYDKAYLNLAVMYAADLEDLDRALPYAREWERRNPKGMMTYQLREEMERLRLKKENGKGKMAD